MRGARAKKAEESSEKLLGAEKAGKAAGKAEKAGKATGKGAKTGVLVLALLVVVIGGVLFMGATAGWFLEAGKVVLSGEYYCGEERTGELTEMTVEEYEELVKEKKSFIMFVDQGGCYTAATMKEWLGDYTKEAGIRVLRMSFSEMKKTALYPEVVKHYPSVVIFREGQAVAALRADADEDAEMYNNEEAFRGWIEERVEV